MFYKRSHVFLILTLLVALTIHASDARILIIYEAEDCKITCAAGNQIGKTIWASGNGRTPDFWGRDVGDEVSWTINLTEPRDNLKLAVRYSYAHGHYTGFAGGSNPTRNLELIIDNQKPYPLTVPDTGWWDLFSTTHVSLPPLSKGAHTFRIRSPLPHTTTNLDCFIFYEGSASGLPVGLLRTEVATSLSNRFHLRLTAHARLEITPEDIFRHFDRIYEHFSDYMGWEPPAPILIHVIEDKLWDNPGATSYQNQWGVYFMAGRMATDQGNWCHEMTHMFYCAHFPWWFDESSVRTLTTFNWAPDLFPQFNKPEDNPYYRQCAAEGRAALENPSRKFDNAEPVQYAIRLKYGPDVFKRFFHLCAEAGRKGEIDFTPGRHLTNAEIVKYLSRAAGQDVTPLYRQWKGFQLPRLPVTKTAVPTSQDRAQEWKYTTDNPSNGWELPGFDDSSWNKGDGGFGTKETPGTVVRTEWKTSDIWLRRPFAINDAVFSNPHASIHHDEDAEIYLNGLLVAKYPGFTVSYQLVPLDRKAHTALKLGSNILAVHCHQSAGGQYIDVGLVEVVEAARE